MALSEHILVAKHGRHLISIQLRRRRVNEKTEFIFACMYYNKTSCHEVNLVM